MWPAKFSIFTDFSKLCVCTQRMDLGECVKIHDLALRADFEIASKQQEFFFELDVSMNYEPFTFWFETNLSDHGTIVSFNIHVINLVFWKAEYLFHVCSYQDIIVISILDLHIF